MQTIKQLTKEVLGHFQTYAKNMADASVAQRKAGQTLAFVKANGETFFRASDDSSLTKGAQGVAFKAWYSKLGMTAQFVSVALSRAEFARLVPELETTFNTDHVKRLAPELNGAKGQKLTDAQKVKRINTVIAKATKLATKDGRDTFTGGDIIAAANRGGNRDTREVSVADVAALTDKAVLTGPDTAEDIATIAAWLEGIASQLVNRTEAIEATEAAQAA